MHGRNVVPRVLLAREKTRKEGNGRDRTLGTRLCVVSSIADFSVIGHFADEAFGSVVVSSLFAGFCRLFWDLVAKTNITD